MPGLPSRTHPDRTEKRNRPVKGSRLRRTLEAGEVFRKPRVLIVEDDADSRDIYAWCMRAAGWSVYSVSNASEALVVAVGTPMDVVIMDLQMPVMSGIEATRWLRSDPRTAKVPVIACTAYASDHFGSMLDIGFDGLVCKPCTPEELQAYVEEFLAEREGE
jgi:CheY-like chemotaxis protein